MIEIAGEVSGEHTTIVPRSSPELLNQIVSLRHLISRNPTTIVSEGNHTPDGVHSYNVPNRLILSVASMNAVLATSSVLGI